MKKTLLEMTQDILSDMSSDEVNSIDDTIESAQVAQIIRSTYDSMIDSRNWPHLRRSIRFQGSGDTSLPTHVTIQDTVKEVLFIKYNCIKDGETRKVYREIKWVDPDNFLRILNKRDNDQDNVDVISDPGGIELLIKNDVAPTYYTSFNDSIVVMDSYDAAVDATIQTSKIQGYAYVSPTWTHTNNFTPDLPEEAFSKLLEEAKSTCMFRLKQVQDLKAEQNSRRQDVWLSRKAFRVNGGIKYPDYGRRSIYKQSSPYFDKNNVGE